MTQLSSERSETLLLAFQLPNYQLPNSSGAHSGQGLLDSRYQDVGIFILALFQAHDGGARAEQSQAIKNRFFITAAERIADERQIAIHARYVLCHFFRSMRGAGVIASAVERFGTIA